MWWENQHCMKCGQLSGPNAILRNWETQNVIEVDLEWKPKWIITLESGKEAQSVLKIEMKTIVNYEIETMEYEDPR